MLGALDSLVQAAIKEQVYVTLLAIYLLDEVFSDKEDEWRLLVRKAKAYLRSAGVEKPDRLIKKFTLQTKQ